MMSYYIITISKCTSVEELRALCTACYQLAQTSNLGIFAALALVQICPSLVDQRGAGWSMQLSSFCRERNGVENRKVRHSRCFIAS